jgi:hypothetical protein
MFVVMPDGNPQHITIALNDIESKVYETMYFGFT